LILDVHANTYGLPPSLITPIAAKSIDAIKTYVGDILDSSRSNSAFVVDFSPLALPDNLKVWNHNRANLINSKKQIWVHVNYYSYRNYYLKNCGFSDISHCVVDHIMNRRFAKCLGYEFVRLIHISRETNTSSGCGPENEGVKYQASGTAPKNQKAVITYADPSDLVKMLDIKTGAFPLDPVRDALKMFYP